MRFINQKAKQLYEEIKRRSIIVEDAYVIPKEEECFDTMDGELYYGSNSFLVHTFDEWEKCKKEGLSFGEAAIQVVSEFVLVADEIFVTKEALVKVREFLSKGVLEELVAKDRENYLNDCAEMEAKRKEQEEQDAFPSSAYW